MIHIFEDVRQEIKRAEQLKAAGKFQFMPSDPDYYSVSLKVNETVEIVQWNNDKRCHILGEEMGEVCKALNENAPKSELRKELIQVAAMAVDWIKHLDN